MSEDPKRPQSELLARLTRDDRAEPGRHASGMNAGEMVVVASFFNPYVGRSFRRSLKRCGVGSRMKRAGEQWLVEVRYGDREQAVRVLTEHRAQHPDRRPKQRRGPYDFTVIGTLLGALAGMGSLIHAPAGSVAVAWIGCVVAGLAAGWAADRLNRSYRYLGRVQFELLDLLLIMFVIAIASAYWSILVRAS